MRFDSPAERKAALRLAKQLAEARGLSRDEDEDEVAAEIVDVVEKTLTEVREHYEAALRGDLEQRGLLRESSGTGQPTKQGSGGNAGPSPTELFKQGQKLAQEMFGSGEE